MLKSLKIYNLLIKLYPKKYRDKYAQQMVQTLSDMLESQSSRTVKVSIWLRAVVDLPINITSQQFANGHAIMSQQMPTYARRGTALSTVLLLPFLVIVPINALRPLSLTWQNILYIGVVILPLIALIIGTVTLLKWLSDKQIKRNGSIRLVIAPPLLAFMIVVFVFGHDSVHCVTDYPLKAFQQVHQTLKCVSNG